MLDMQPSAEARASCMSCVLPERPTKGSSHAKQVLGPHGRIAQCASMFHFCRDMWRGFSPWLTDTNDTRMPSCEVDRRHCHIPLPGSQGSPS
jgi:hypothetical protein